MNFQKIAETVLGASPAQQTEVVAVEENDNLTRFANNTIHQNVTERNVQITVRSVVGTRVGIAVSNDARPERLRKLAQLAFEVAKLQPQNPEFKGMPLSARPPNIVAFDEAAAECTPEGRARRVGVICGKSTAAGCTAAGSLSTSTSTLGVANSEGVYAEHRSTAASCSTVIMSSNSSGWAQSSGWKLDAIAPDKLADEALEKVRRGVDPVDFEPGEYAVILDPYATADLVEMLAFDGMSALAVQEGRSWLNGRIGQKIMSDSISIVDDGLDPDGFPMPFDFEGVPKKKVPVVKAGVAMGPVYDTFTAGREEGKHSTGHAIPPSPSARYGPLPLNLFLRPGSATLEGMIRSTKLGLYITRFWYTRPVHPRDVVITGMTRDGTFVIRDGEIAHPIKPLRFTQSYVEALHNTEAVGSVPRLLRTDYGTAVSVPSVKLGKFRFTSSTR